MINKSKYKDSPLGRIPEDWEVSLLDNLTKRGSGHTPDKEFEEYYNGGIKWISLADSSHLDHGLIVKTEIEISDLGIKKSSAVLHSAGTVVMSRDAGVGKSAVMGIDMAVSQHFIAWTCKNELDNWYLYYWLQSKKEFFERQAVGSTIKTIGLPLFKKLKIQHPRFEEQQVIAQTLRTIDDVITKTTQLIAQKELRKKWLMQQLLTGKKRLKGFSGEWEQLSIDQLFNPIIDINDGEVIHSIMTISAKQGLLLQNEKFDRIIAGESLKKYTQLRNGDFAYNKGNSKTYQMGCVYQLEEFPSALVPFVYICFSPSELIDPRFYKFWFYAHGLDRQLQKVITSGARGDGLLNVNSSDFFNLKLPFPQKDEQTEISQFLQIVDQEIKLLKSKLEKLKQQRKGMIQQLLTGIVKLTV
jgi:type I restriction enzyme S subunit